MLVYRIAKTRSRAQDLSGAGAFQYGGRWNSKGTYMLYCSENSSLAYLENLVHVDEFNFPPRLFIAELGIAGTAFGVLAEERYPPGWQQLDNLENKLLGDAWMRDQEYIGYKIRSAVNPFEFNILLNPLFPGYPDLIKVNTIREIILDTRLVKR